MRRSELAAVAAGTVAGLLLMGGGASGGVQIIGNTTLTVTVEANGGGPATGRVTSADGYINCPGTCSHTYSASTILTHGVKVALTAAPGSAYGPPDWGIDGDETTACSHAATTCTVTMNKNHAVDVLFNYPYTVTVSKAGTGHGTVTGQGQVESLDCGSTCSATFFAAYEIEYLEVDLSETPDADSTFAGWSGCHSVDPSTDACVADVFAPPGHPTTVTATFTLKRYDLTVQKAGNGSGTVSSNPAGISCGGDCKETYDAGTKVALQATSAVDSTFGGFSGACTGTGACVVTMDAAKSVTATFDLVPQGGGGGTGGGDGSGGGGGVGGGGGGTDQQVDADVLGVKTGKTLLGKRQIAVEVSADETLTVALVLTRNGKTLVSKHVDHFAAGDRVIRLVIPTGVKAGKAKLTITLEDEAGNTTSVNRSVKIGKHR